MTPPIDDPEALREILATTDALLLDFDGPVCSLFAGLPAHVVADQLRQVLAAGGHSKLPLDVEQATDPFVVLFHAAALGEEEVRYVDAAFRALEADAVRSAKPTAGSHDLLRGWKLTDRPLAIVSNNSVAAIAAYLDFYDLRSATDVIAARANADSALLKPNPHLVDKAITMLKVQPARCTLVGDSPTDIQAARAAHARSVGYANKPGKTEALSNAQPTAITTTMMLLTGAFRGD
ncbi:HAD family hydrolase [Actinophytocola sp. NPDC049390]|uniref:HAD family hydrolase n=1 Tax=Actinophytocola sp. NPDC049390 TaxID=3363894 RepID=UPI00378823AC